MSPLDHELRTALRSRAHDLSPSPDVLAGVERRAGRMRRQRVAAAVAGSALAISAVAVVVPGLVSSVRTDPGPLATSEPTAAPVPGRPANALDWPSTPLDPTAQGDGAYLDEYAVRSGREDRPRGEVLFSGAVPGQATVKVYQLWYDDGPARAVVMQASEAGAVLLRDTDAAPDLPVVDAVTQGGGGPGGEAAASSGDDVPYVVVVAPPGTAGIEYAADGRRFDARWNDRTALVPRTGPSDVQRRDELRLLDADGRTTYQGPVWLGAAEGQEGDDGSSDGEPANLLADWPVRGVANPELRLAAERAFAEAMGRAGARVQSRVLLGGDDDARNAFVLLQAWLPGGPAHTVGYQVRPVGEPLLRLGPATDPGAPVLALLVQRAPGQDDDTLVVVPQPRTGQVLYAAAGGELRPVEPAPGLDGVVLLDRSPGTRDDRLVLLDGNGDLDAPTFDGPVSGLLCGLREDRC